MMHLATGAVAIAIVCPNVSSGDVIAAMVVAECPPLLACQHCDKYLQF